MTILNRLADILWPPACILCKNYCRETVCKECKTQSLLYDGGSAFDGAPQSDSLCAPSCRRIYAVGIYAGKYKDAVVSYKFEKELWIGKGFADLMYKMLKENGTLDECSCITYVPVSDERFYERGFDQSEFIAKQVSKKAGKLCLPLIVKKTQGTAQSKFNRKERLEKSHDRFVYNENAFLGKVVITEEEKLKNVILIDDILTTGATLEECASLLKNVGFQSVVGAVLATGRKDI